ncbi:MAG: ABC transporter substrate-binding protein [Erysipelotrichaceae bacterium]|nr:ABC transporter substrate-binding protein [Erysipelotrichaceae bacterium]MDY5252541.1 ABC transporter substrate-binding protein [Erysipelotrichaceae bacterium]
MKKLVYLMLCAAMVLGISGCSSTTNEEASTGCTLTVSTFQLSEDIVNEDIVKPFEEKYNCDVITDLGNAADRYTKLQNNPESGIDVIELNQSTAARGYEAGLFETLDSSKVTNLGELIAPAKAMQEASGYGPAFVIQSVGIVYDKEAVGYEITSWDDLWNEDLAGAIAIPDITTTFGPAMVYIASEHAGQDITVDNGEAAFKALEEIKPNVVKTYTKSSDLANMFAAGEIKAAVVGDFAVPNIQKAANQVVYMVPESGTYANFNTIDVVASSDNKEMAYKYIEWRISQQLQAVTSLSLNEGPTNANVELNEEQAKNLTYGKVAENAKTIDYTFVNPLLPEWTDQWNRILNR